MKEISNIFFNQKNKKQNIKKFLQVYEEYLN